MTPDVPSGPRSDTPYKIGLALALLGAVAWAALAPSERSLGDGIRIVYLHVSATLAGLACLYGVGAVGAVGVVRPLGAVGTRLRFVWVAGLWTFALGFALSLVSATVSWGGIFWAEPRVRASLGVVAVGLLAPAVRAGLANRRLRDLVWPVSAVLIFVVLRTAALYVHPDHPIKSTTPLGIRGAFVAIFVLFLVASLCLAKLMHGWSDGRRTSLPE